MRYAIGLAAVVMMLVGCKGGGGSATVDECVAKFMAQNAGSGDAEKKLFTGVCGELTPEQRGCAVKATSKDELNKCVPSGKPK
jgi:hypothetical protein